MSIDNQMLNFTAGVNELYVTVSHKVNNSFAGNSVT